MAKTLAQCISYVRAKIGELDSQRIFPELLKADINFAQQKVQQDLVPLGIKNFNKTVYNTGSYFTTPSDMLTIPDAIEDIVGSSGVKASITVITSAGGSQTYSAIEPGTGWNGWEITFIDTTGLSVSLDFGVKKVNVSYNGSTTTNQQCVDFLNADTLFSTYFTVSTSAPGETMTDGIGSGGALEGGTGAGWTGCREMTVSERNRISGNVYLSPSVTDPAYLRHGDGAGIQKIEILPSEITNSKMYYYYRLADLSVESDTLGIPIEYEELVLMYAVTRAYETLGKTAETEVKRLDYERKRQEYEQAYQNALASKAMERRRTQSNDQLQ